MHAISLTLPLLRHDGRGRAGTDPIRPDPIRTEDSSNEDARWVELGAGSGRWIRVEKQSRRRPFARLRRWLSSR